MNPLKEAQLRALNPYQPPKPTKKRKEADIPLPDVKPVIATTGQFSRPAQPSTSIMPPPTSLTTKPTVNPKNLTTSTASIPSPGTAKRSSVLDYVAPAREKSILTQNHTIVNYLRKIEKEVTAEQIRAATGFDVLANDALLEQLRQNPKISYEDGTFSYKVIFLFYLLPFSIVLLTQWSRCTVQIRRQEPRGGSRGGA